MIIYKKKNSKIKNIKAIEILDSRGYPTVEVELETDFGKFLAAVPSGASKSKYEALELRDGGKRYFGKGVKKAIKNIKEILAPKLIGLDPRDQKKIDNVMIELDGSENKSKLGVNSILPISMATCRAGAESEGLFLYQYIAKLTSNFQKPLLPSPLFNVINGGVHAGGDLDFQEFMICPLKNSFSENLKIASEIYHKLKEILIKKFGKQSINLGDEGGFVPKIKFPEKAIELILEASKILNYKIKIVLDVAASQFFKKGKYKTKMANFNRENLLKYYQKLIKNYPILGLEDPFSQEDLEGWNLLMNLKDKILIIGDDLLATNPQRIKLAKEKNLCNSAIVKLNQIGTVTETIEAVKLAKSFGWKIIVSHRSGETNDDFISDFAVGIGAEFIKAGAPARGERVAKYNRLLKIEKDYL
jgi:enolase